MKQFTTYTNVFGSVVKKDPEVTQWFGQLSFHAAVKTMANRQSFPER